jgi:hypothetical protein
LEDGKWVFVLFLVFFYKNGKYTEGSLSFSLSIDYVNGSDCFSSNLVKVFHFLSLKHSFEKFMDKSQRFGKRKFGRRELFFSKNG